MSASAPKSMRAVHIPAFTKSISTLHPSTVPLHYDPKSTVLIKVSHVSPTHVDILYAQGKHQNNRTIAKPPFILGTDFAGVVVSVPEGSDLEPGERIYGSYFGAFAEYVAVHPGSGSIRRVPASWTNAEACAVGSSGATSLGCFLRAGSIVKGEWVLVTGATGGLGILACQIARALGARVIALVGDDEKAKVLTRLGFNECVKYTDEKWEQQVLKISNGGVAVVYDAVGLVERGLRCCKYGGTVVIVGFAGRDGKMEKLQVNRILLKSAGVLGYRFGEHRRRNPDEVAKIWADFDRMVATGAITPVVYKEQYRDLESIVKALEDMEARKVWGRAVVTISDIEASKSKI